MSVCLYVCTTYGTCTTQKTHAVAYFTTTQLIDAHVLENEAVKIFLASLLACRALYRRNKGNSKNLYLFLFAFAVRLAARNWRGVLASHSQFANVGIVVLMTAIAMRDKPTASSVLAGVFVVRILGELTAQDTLLFFGQGFMAQLSQGVAHGVSGQPSTLLSHEGDTSHSRAAKLAFEWSHVNFFPSLLVHACLHSTLHAS